MLNQVTDPKELTIYKLKPDVVATVSKVRPSEDEIEAQVTARLRKRVERGIGRREPKRHLSASLIPNKCSRSVAFDLAGYAEEEVAPSPQARHDWERAAVIGDYLHAVWQDALRFSGLLYVMPTGLDAAEVDLKELAALAGPDKDTELYKSRISGRADGRGLRDQLYEIKGVATKDFNPDLPWFVDKLKLEQAQVYLHFAGLERTRFIVVRREAANWFSPDDVMEFEYWPSEANTNATLDKAGYIIKEVQAGREGEVEANPHGRRSFDNCRLCGFKSICSAYPKEG